MPVQAVRLIYRLGVDLKFDVTGKIYTTNTGASAYGVMINGNSSSEFKLSAGKDILVVQNAAIASEYSNGYGISVTGTATLNANNDINFLQNGPITGSGYTFGILVDGKGGVAALNANNDINFLQNGPITGSGATYGILVDGSKSGSVALTAIHDINFTNNGAVTGGGNSFGIELNGNTGKVTLKSDHDTKIVVNSDSVANGKLSYSLGIEIFDASITAGNDIIIDQSGLSQADIGGAFGIDIYSSTPQAGTVNYSLYAKNDIWFTQNGNISSGGYQNYAAGVSISNSRVLAGRNVYGYQGGDVTQNYRSSAVGVDILNTELQAGYDGDYSANSLGTTKAASPTITDSTTTTNTDSTTTTNTGSINIIQNGTVSKLVSLVRTMVALSTTT